MQINVAESSGFCFGVTRALNICDELLKQKGDIYILGEVVHNRHVVEDLEAKGIKRIDKLFPIKNAKLVIRAHGAGKQVFDKATECGFEIIDATCPKVKEIYHIARRLEKERSLVIIGDKRHDEVIGIAGQLEKKPLVIDSPEDAALEELDPSNPIAVVTQSTQSDENVTKVLEKIKQKCAEVQFVDTTCRITRIKQREIRSLPEDNDAVFIIGSRGSANTRRLYEISKKKNPNTYWLESAEEAESCMIEGADNIGIMSGASTPEYVTAGVIARLKQFDAERER